MTGESLHYLLCLPLPTNVACYASGRLLDPKERLRQRTWLLRLQIRLIPKDYIIAEDQLLHLVDKARFDRVCPWETFVGVIQALYPGLLAAFQELCGDWHMCEEALKPVPTTLHYGGRPLYLDRAHLPSRKEWQRRVHSHDPAQFPTASLLRLRRWHVDLAQRLPLSVVEHHCVFEAVIPSTGTTVATLTTAGVTNESAAPVLVVESLQLDDAYLGLGIELQLLLEAASLMNATSLVWAEEAVVECRLLVFMMYTLGGYYDRADRQWLVELPL